MEVSLAAFAYALGPVEDTKITDEDGETYDTAGMAALLPMEGGDVDDYSLQTTFKEVTECEFRSRTVYQLRVPLFRARTARPTSTRTSTPAASSSTATSWRWATTSPGRLAPGSRRGVAGPVPAEAPRQCRPRRRCRLRNRQSKARGGEHTSMEFHEAANFLFDLRRFALRPGTDATRDLLQLTWTTPRRPAVRANRRLEREGEHGADARAHPPGGRPRRRPVHLPAPRRHTRTDHSRWSQDHRGGPRRRVRRGDPAVRHRPRRGRGLAHLLRDADGARPLGSSTGRTSTSPSWRLASVARRTPRASSIRWPAPSPRSPSNIPGSSGTRSTIARDKAHVAPADAPHRHGDDRRGAGSGRNSGR